LQTFVEYVNSLKLCKNQKDNLIEDKKRLEEMNMTLKKFRSKEDQTFNTQLQVLQIKIEDIQTGIGEVEGVLQNSEGTVTETKDNYVVEVDQKIQEEKDRVGQHIERLAGEQLMNPETDPADAQKIISRIKKDFDDTVAKLGKYKQY
jgi:hypothetical protein